MRTRIQTPAGTRSAVLRISLRSEVNSEIVLVPTETTGRALRPWARSWTPSPHCQCRAGSWWRSAPSRRLPAGSRISGTPAALLGELRVGLGERLVEHQLRENRCAVSTFGARDNPGLASRSNCHRPNDAMWRLLRDRLFAQGGFAPFDEKIVHLGGQRVGWL
jgi:hypothetical protein